MDYQKIYNDAKKELEVLKQKQAVLKDNIEQKVKVLGLEVGPDLESKLEELKASAVNELVDCEARIAERAKQLDDLKLTIDE